VYTANPALWVRSPGSRLASSIHDNVFENTAHGATERCSIANAVISGRQFVNRNRSGSGVV